MIGEGGGWGDIDVDVHGDAGDDNDDDGGGGPIWW